MTYRLASARAPDGAAIGYRAYGDPARPAIALVHGGMQSAASFDHLARALAATFSVYVPDRRGRGLSPAPGTIGTLASEVADLTAVIEATGARGLFGLSSGAVISLATALAHDRVAQLALYEPPLRIAGVLPDDWAPRFQRELDHGNPAGALVAAIKGTADHGVLGRVPDRALELAFRAMIKWGAPGTLDAPSVPELIPTMRTDCAVVAASAPLGDQLPALRATVLLLGGARSHPNLHAINAAIAARLPAARRVELAGVGHTAAANDGRPALVAAELSRFFA